MSNLIYGVTDKPKTLKEYLLFGFQQTLAILTATILISTISGTDIAAGLVAGGISTIFFLAITGFKASVFISNSGATASAVIGTLALTKSVETNMVGVVVGGATVMLIYSIASILIKHFGVQWIDRLIPPIIAGTTVLVIGINLSGYIPTYAQLNNNYSVIGVIIGLCVMFATAICARYAKGIWSTIPMIVGFLLGYLACLIITLCGYPILDLSVFNNIHIFALPDFAFLHLNFRTFDWSTVPSIMLMFGLVSLASLSEHIGDMITASKITETDLLKEPGLHRTLLGDGIGSFIGCLVGAQPNTTYSESLSTIVISRVASVYVILVGAIFTILLGFIEPFQAVVLSSQNAAIFSGIALVAYGLIALSGLRVLVTSDIDWSKPKNMMIFACMLTSGASGLTVTIGNFVLSGIALSMIVGIILNIILGLGERNGTENN